MFCQSLLYSKVTQLYMNIHSFSHIIFYHVLPQVIGYSSLCYTAGPHLLEASYGSQGVHILIGDGQRQQKNGDSLFVPSFRVMDCSNFIGISS